MVVGYVIEEEVQMMDDGHPTTDLRLIGGDMMYSTSWDTSIPCVCEVQRGSTVGTCIGCMGTGGTVQSDTHSNDNIRRSEAQQDEGRLGIRVS